MKTLSIDIGGTGLKAAILDEKGKMAGEEARVETPYPCPPSVMLKALGQLVKPLPPFDRVSVGFPGVVRDGLVITAPHFGNKLWYRFEMVKALEKLFKRPARILNDADMQGLAVVKGKGLELVVTLGTGVGTALFHNGELMPHLELAQHPSVGGKIYNDYIGDAVLKKKGKKKWNHRVRKALDLLNILFNYDHLYIGGGNSRHITFKLDKNMTLVSNVSGILGGLDLWK